MYHKRLKKGFTPFCFLNLFQELSHGSCRKFIYKLRSFPNALTGNVKTLLINRTSPIKTLGDDKSGYVGFTLIELLVVVLIIGILAAVALPQYQKAVLKSKSSQILSTINSIAISEEEYFLANSEYTTNLDNLVIDIKATSTGAFGGIPSGKNYKDGNYYYNLNSYDTKHYFILGAYATSSTQKPDIAFIRYSNNYGFHLGGVIGCVAWDEPGLSVCTSMGEKTNTFLGDFSGKIFKMN